MPDEHDSDKMYSLVCEKRFDSMEAKQDQVLDILRGKNSEPGLIEEVRTIKRRWKWIIGSGAVIVTALVTQLIQWLFKVLQ